MKIKVPQEKIAKALNSMSRIAAGAKTTLPILANVLIRVNDGVVELVTTNLDMAMVTHLTVADAQNGVITVPARLMAEFIGNLPKGEMVEVTAEGEKVLIRAGEYSSSINGAAADDFPELPEISAEGAVKITMPMEEFKAGLTQVMIAVGNDMTRPALTGVYFNSYEGYLYLAATDGYRLAERKLEAKVESEIGVIVPAATLRNVMSLINDEIDEVEIWFDEAQVKFKFGEVEIISKLLDGVYPNYRQLLPKESEIAVELPKDELMRVTKIAALFAHEVGGSIVCTTSAEEGVFKVASVANELGENTSEIKTKVELDGKITFNARFLIDALNVINDKTVTFKFSNRLDPIVLETKKDVGYIHIIMPLKR